MSHSKHNTSLAFFTAHEREELKSVWGSRSTRLSRDSFLPFGSCRLCLLPARDPVSCPSHGHLFCRECALSNLLAQKKEIKRLDKEYIQKKQEEVEAEDIKREQEQERAVQDFELVQQGLNSKLGPGNAAARHIIGREAGKVIVEEQNPDKQGTKRKLEIDEEELKRLGGQNTKLKKDDQNPIDQKAATSFWIPSLTPSSSTTATKPTKSTPQCPASTSDKPHDFSLKLLVSVQFTEEKTEGSNEPVRSCPSCKKALTNSTKAMLAKPCGHVLCKPCATKFMKPSEKDAHDASAEVGVVRCYVCQTNVTDKKREKKEGKEEKEKVRPGVVEISSEGTGFAGGGNNMVKKKGVAFQV
ncbi:unnamed protein product [Aureobasidium vineae]|uniref:RING-type domain-containing protein n=1 Tax=Aureobasidium vineae TaxID=2773715 RepID=A0A9N8JJC6_9PEZI|nr:unnamed protein product [Aureobasidium vineae]